MRKVTTGRALEQMQSFQKIVIERLILLKIVRYSKQHLMLTLNCEIKLISNLVMTIGSETTSAEQFFILSFTC